MRARYTLFFLALLLSSCYSLHRSSGGGQRVEAPDKRQVDVSDVAVVDGFQIEVVATGLTFPTGIAFDDEGVPYVIEAGYSYGEVFTTPKLLRINSDGSTDVVATGSNNGPWNGVWYHEGNFYIAEGGQLEGGKIIKADKKGNLTELINNLPSFGDHHTNGPLVHNGYVYFGQGTATNSGVIGEDNYKFGWLKRKPEFHDIPCRDIKLVGVNYTTDNVFAENSANEVSTGAYLPYGTASTNGQVISGQVPCTGAVLRVALEGGEPELVAWGFRNPYGFAVNNKGEMYITENGYDDRGSRPVWGTGDYLWKVEEGKWYGWPDFSGGHNLAEGHLKVPGEKKPKQLLAQQPGDIPEPTATLGVHSSSNSFDFSTSEDFGFVGEAFIAQFGDMAPGVGKVMDPVGYKVVRVNTNSGVINDFAVNKKGVAPASKLNTKGLERPNAARFSPDGSALYIVDFGIMLTSDKGPEPLKETGVIWKVTKISR